MLGAFLDLILPQRCAGCGALGGALCRSCTAALCAAPAPRRPCPAPAGLPVCWSAAEYAGVARRALLAYKERGRTALGPPLARALTAALTAALAAAWAAPPPGVPVTLVPVPGTRSARRARGHEPVARLAALAAAALRAAGRPVRTAPLLVLRRRVADQATLGAAGRAANLAGALRAVPAARGAWCVPVDDIVTTGATLAEAARALRAAGARVPCAATVAATRRRT